MEKEEALKEKKEWEEYCKEIESRTFSIQEPETLLSTLEELREVVDGNHALRCWGRATPVPVPKLEIGDYQVKEYVEYLDTEEDGIVDCFSFLGAKNKKTGQVIDLKDKYDDQLLLDHLKEKEHNIFQRIIHSAKKMAFTYSIPIVSELLCRDKDFMLEAIKIDKTNIFDASEELKNDKNFILESIKIHPSNMFHASEELKNDKDFMLGSIPNEIFKSELKKIYQDLSQKEEEKEILHTINPFEKKLVEGKVKGLGR